MGVRLEEVKIMDLGIDEETFWLKKLTFQGMTQEFKLTDTEDHKYVLKRTFSPGDAYPDTELTKDGKEATDHECEMIDRCLEDILPIGI